MCGYLTESAVDFGVVRKYFIFQVLDPGSCCSFHHHEMLCGASPSPGKGNSICTQTRMHLCTSGRSWLLSVYVCVVRVCVCVSEVEEEQACAQHTPKTCTHGHALLIS